MENVRLRRNWSFIIEKITWSPSEISRRQWEKEKTSNRKDFSSWLDLGRVRRTDGCTWGFDFWSSKAFEGGNHVPVHTVAVLVHFFYLWSHDGITVWVHFQIVRISTFGPVFQSGPKLCIRKSEWTKSTIPSSDHKFSETVSGPKLQSRHVITTFNCFTG